MTKLADDLYLRRIEEIHACIILAGGAVRLKNENDNPVDALAEMPLKEVLAMLICNDMDLHVIFDGKDRSIGGVQVVPEQQGYDTRMGQGV